MRVSHQVKQVNFLNARALGKSLQWKVFNYFFFWGPERGGAFEPAPHSWGKQCDSPKYPPLVSRGQIQICPFSGVYNPGKREKPKGQKRLPLPFKGIISVLSLSPPIPGLFIASCQACPDVMEFSREWKETLRFTGNTFWKTMSWNRTALQTFSWRPEDPHKCKPYEGMISRPSRNRCFSFFLPVFPIFTWSFLYSQQQNAEK